jgi:hypothetical protein
VVDPAAVQVEASVFEVCEELRAELSNCIFETVEAIEEALTEALRPFWNAPERLASLPGTADGSKTSTACRHHELKSVLALCFMQRV